MSTRLKANAKAQSSQKPSFIGLRSGRLQRSSTNHARSTTVLPIVHEVLRSPGQPLDPATRTFMEPCFGHDFSQVRVHTNAKAAHAVNARAFTLSHDIVFGSGQYQPETSAGRQLLAHELTHVVQQEVSSAEPRVQRTFLLSELLTPQRTARHSNPVAARPDTYFYPGSARNTSNRRALVVAGIHGTEVSARQLGIEVNDQLSRGMTSTDFHTIVIPRANPTGLRGAGSQSAGTYVPDLNREFGAGHMSPNPYAQRIASIVSEFDPERILSVHAITGTPSAGIFLDPIHTGTYPGVGTEGERRRAFTGDPHNVGPMRLTEAMIPLVGTGRRYTLGNVSRRDFPASEYPTPPGGRSAYSLIYPQQSQVSRSLGTWASGLGKTVITIEIPGYRAMRTIWSAFLPAVWRFLQIPAPTPAPQAQGQLIQPKLKVGPPGDRYEQEADRVAEQVMQMPEPSVQRKVELEEEERKEMLHTRSLTHQVTPLVQRQIEPEEEEHIQTKQNSRQTAYIDSNLEVQIQSLRGGGQPLARSARNFFESRFGYDFSHVRIYDDTRTAELAQALNAQAFTTDQNIFLRPGEYVPETVDGRRLLAHELVHVVQQTRPPALESHEQFRSTPAERITPLMYSTEKNIVQRSGQCSPQICQPNPLDVRQPPPTSSSMAVDLDGFGVLQSSGYSMNFANILYRHLTTGTAIGIQYFQFLGSEYPLVGFCIPYERKLWNNTFLEDILQGCYGYQRSSLRHRDMRMISATVFSNALSQLEIFDEADRSTPLTRATLRSKPRGTNLTGPPIKGILLLMATDRFLSSLSMTAGAVSSMTVPSSTRGTTPSADIIEWSATPTPTRATSHSVSIGGATQQVIGDPNRFDDLIVYWTNHFNEIFQPLNIHGHPNPLNPDLVKAMIYSESRFEPAAGFSGTPQTGILGLMQVGSTERRSAGDVPAGITGITGANFADASVQIATGIRILFEKYQRVRDWELAVERYNSRAGYRSHVMHIYSIMRRP